MKILIVDDNEHRMKEIISLLNEKFGFSRNDIYEAINTQSAKTHMRNINFDFLILDVVLPKRDESPKAQFGLSLLEEIKTRPNIKKPSKIVGITSHFEDINGFREKFNEHCEVLIEASSRNTSWKAILVNAIKSEINRINSAYSSQKNINCITVHGIRTRGEWQEELKKLFNSNVSNIDFTTYKYGYFTVISFFIPFLRMTKVRHFAKQLEILCNKDEHDKEFIFFSHSFGTYIVVKAINDYFLKKNKNINVRLIVLAGSVLPSDYNFNLILENTDAIIVNDCGIEDKILFLSEIFIPNTGMAGRIGFYSFNNKRFVNRFFLGGHSHYFDMDNSFMEKYWLPLIGDSSRVEIIDNRIDSFITTIIEKSFSFFGKIKILMYLLVIFFMIKTILF